MIEQRIRLVFAKTTKAMLIHVLSVLHVEFGDFVPPPTNADVVVLAGDIHVGTRGIEWARQVFPKQPVIYVPGNHEFYGQTMSTLVQKMKTAAQGTNIHILENDVVQVKDVTFVGATLWTDFELYGDKDAAIHKALVSDTDFQRIRIGSRHRRLRPSDTIAHHKRTSTWMEDATRDVKGARVLITHHAPSASSLPEEYDGDQLSPTFASNMEGYAEKVDAPLWIHGHIHASSDYEIGSTRVACNPRGYHPDELNPKFAANFVVEV